MSSTSSSSRRATRVPTSRTNSEIALEDTRTPIPTAKLLEDISTTTSSVDKDDLRTVVTEMGLAFDGTGEDLGQIIDTSNSFIETANANFDTTTKLIKDSNTVLSTSSTARRRSGASPTTWPCSAPPSRAPTPTCAR